MEHLIFLFVLLNIMYGQDNRQNERYQMVQFQIQGRGVTCQATLEAMKSVERHRLVPVEYQHLAYSDTPLPIGYGQTISQPYIVAFMTEAIRPKKGMKVLEIGTGSGYQAAILAEMGCEVYTIEIVKELGERSKRDLLSMGYKNVHVKVADGYRGWPEFAPFDAIIVTAAPETIPPPLLEQLKEGGRLIIPVGPQHLTQQLLLAEKLHGIVHTRTLAPVRFVPFLRDNQE
jgi:protein-L-isoaspartate(D-aspartate) O-methyltransferase